MVTGSPLEANAALMTIDLFGKMVNIDPHYGNNFIDAKVLDRKGTAEDEALDKILELAGDGKFTLLLAHSVKAEIERPNTPQDSGVVTWW
jgi:hypothetical protein